MTFEPKTDESGPANDGVHPHGAIMFRPISFVTSASSPWRNDTYHASTTYYVFHRYCYMKNLLSKVQGWVPRGKEEESPQERRRLWGL